jgi:hypothetical protein
MENEMPKNPTFFAGEYRAVSYAYGIVATVPGLIVDNPSGSTSGATQTLNVAFGNITLQDGTIVGPLNTNAPVTVGTGSNAETVTPSAVSNNTPTVYQSSSFTATTFSNAHGTGDKVASGTVGLQEAINAASAAGGGYVIVDAEWAQSGGTDAMIEAAILPAGVSLTDNRTGGEVTDVTVTLTATQVNTMFTTPVELIPAPKAGSFIVVQQAIFVNENGGTAWTAGGAITVGYSNANPGSPDALSGTVAATFLTSPTVKQILTLAGAQIASAAESTVDALGIFISNATQLFATGTGVLKIRLLYTVVKS